MNVTLCLRNGSHVDTYSVPGKSLDEGSDVPATVIERDHEIKAESSSKAPENAFLHEITHYLQSCSIKQLRLFLTDVRKRLKMKSFDWPEAAENRFIAEMKAPVPSAPGRSNSGKKPLIHMLKLSVEVDDAWKRCVSEALNKSEPSRLADASNHSFPDLTSEYEDMDTTDSISRRTHEQRNHRKSDHEQQIFDVDVQNLTPHELIEVVRGLPHDELKVTVPKNAWVPLPVLLSNIFYPKVRPGIEWYIQHTPSDGNCMFSAILVTAKLRGCLHSSIDSVAKMRSALRDELLELSRAGQISSKYRRDWLASCLHDVDDTTLERYCYMRLEKAAESYREADLEDFLAPLRVFVSNWASMVGGEHWGGLLRAELFILATKLGAVIEILKPSRSSSVVPSSVQHISAWDTQFESRITALERRDLIYPHSGTMPSVDQRYMGPVMNAKTDNGWVGPYPVIRLALNDRHYNACTSKYSYPISVVDKKTTKAVSSEWFEFSDTLVEPFCSLSRKENEYHRDAIQRIQHWRDACKLSPESGNHADSIVIQTKCSELSVSMLSHLEVQDTSWTEDQCYLMSDDIITCYMHLLQKRTEKLNDLAIRKGFERPPRTIYMDTWFFKALWRGPSGPASTKKRLDLSPYSIIVIPALIQGHWILAACYVEIGVIGVYDPFDVPRYDVFNVVKCWAEAQLPDGNNSWRFHHVRESRRCKQIGSIDCGIYVCKAAESLGLGIPVRISQADICYARKRMMVEFMLQEVSNIKWPRH